MCGICGDWTHDNQKSVHHPLSRRRLLQTGAAVVEAGTVLRFIKAVSKLL